MVPTVAPLLHFRVKIFEEKLNLQVHTFNAPKGSKAQTYLNLAVLLPPPTAGALLLAPLLAPPHRQRLALLPRNMGQVPRNMGEEPPNMGQVPRNTSQVPPRAA